MREIKFRLFIKENNKMIEWKEIHDYFPFDFTSNTFQDWFNGINDYKNQILMQYIGIKDKNGKEIYEGDIVKYNWTISDKAEIVWNELFFRWDGKVGKYSIPLMGRAWEKFEVIGNVYENKL